MKIHLPTRTPEQQLSANLLTAIGMKPESLVNAFAEQHPYDRIRDCVAYWYLNRKSVGGIFNEIPGVIVYWLNHWDLAVIPPMHPDFFATDLYHNYRPEAEIQAEQVAEAEALQRLCQWRQEINQSQPATAIADSSIASIYAQAWQQLITELEASMPQAAYISFIKNNLTLVAVQEPPPQLTFTIKISRSTTEEWIKRQLTQRLQFSLKTIFRQPVTIHFQSE